MAVSVVVLAVASACGSTSAPRAPAAGERGAKDSGLSLDDVAERLLADVAWLADDAREGRRAGTEGERAAGEWIAARFADLGLEPAGAGGTFLQELTVPLPVSFGPATRVEAPEGRTLSGERDVVPAPASSGGEASGALAWRGYGIVDPVLGWNDYERRCDGAVAVVVLGTPPERFAPAPEAREGESTGNVEAAGGWGSAGSLMLKVRQAKHHGAVAVLLVPHPDRLDQPLPEPEHGGGVEAGIPVLALSHAAAKALIAGYDALAGDAGASRAASAEDGPTVRVVADVVRARGPAFNVLARLPGARGDRCVVIGAHYDHLGRGGEGSLAPAEHGEIHNGADDNASGTAVVLEIARALAAGPRPESDVVLALWSGEELGLLGSEHWAQEPTVPLERVAANVNLDMVGRAGRGTLQVLGAGSAEPFAEWLAELGERAGLALEVDASGQGVGGSDHQTFLKRRIPAVHFFSGLHADYHKPSDDVERFEAAGAARVATLGAELVRRIAAEAPLEWREPPAPSGERGAMRDRGFRVWFGTMPDYAFEGPGLRLSGTSPGSPAETAGMIAGDVVLQVGDVEVGDIGDFMFALQKYKPGDVVRTRFLRDGEPQDVRVTLTERP